MQIGRGLPRSVACGREFTIVATYPYQGPDLEVATKLMEEARIREQEEFLLAQQKQQQALLAKTKQSEGDALPSL